MFGYQSSIRLKIILGYLLIILSIALISLLIFMEMGAMEKKVLAGEDISEFFETTLEMRRFEKNYFLYRHSEDLAENVRYTDVAAQLLSQHIEKHSDAEDTAQLARVLLKDLAKYKSSMEQLGRAVGDMKKVDAATNLMMENIRDLGKGITIEAEKMSRAEKENLKKSLGAARRFILVSIMGLTLFSLLVGRALSRMVVKPLEQFEHSMNLISEGGFKMILIDSRDREISSLINAFNKMLTEMEARRRHMIRSEKLASLGTLLSGVAHELNNPLSNISTSCQILIEEISQDDREYRMQLLSNIDEQTVRARNIVRCLLDFSRDEYTRKEFFLLCSLLYETVGFVKIQMKKSAGAAASSGAASGVEPNVEIIIDVAEDLKIYANRQRLQQVFLNLMKNAAESISDEGIVRVTATGFDSFSGCMEGVASCVKKSGGCIFSGGGVDIAVNDTGSGIPHEVLPHVLDPFYTTKEAGRGTGLGLFVVHEIIEEHGGCITLSSEPGRGTKVSIRLPAKVSTEASAENLKEI
jgi:signal transduction histidine kinase